jgi:hypothetical protein
VLILENEICLLEKYKLTPTELFTIKIILLAKEDGEYQWLQRYVQLVNLRDILISLQNKSIILKSYKIPNKGEQLEVEDIPFNKVFQKQYFKASFEMGAELFETYPMFANINGAIVSIRSISKKFNTPEDAFRYYSKAINWNPEKHKEIIDLIKWEQNNEVHFINMSLSSFIIDRKWNELQALKDGKLANINYETIRSL